MSAPSIHRPTRLAGRWPGHAAWPRFMQWNGLVLRWLFVLLLAFDQMGAPLHAHRHDSGIDGSALATLRQADASPVSVSTSCPSSGASTLFHASTPVRMQVSGVVDEAQTDDAHSCRTDLLGLLAGMWPDAAPEQSSFVSRSDRPAPRGRLPGLPPASRAPPRHA